MDYHCSAVFLSVVIRYTVFRSAHPSSSDSLWLSSVLSLLSPSYGCWCKINKRGESVEDKINKLDVELCKYREQIQKTRSGPVQQALKACMKDNTTCFIIRHSISIKSLSLLNVSKMLNKLSYMRARLPWGSPSVNNSEFWSPSSAGTQLLKEGTPFLIILETYPLPRYIRKVGTSGKTTRSRKPLRTCGAASINLKRMIRGVAGIWSMAFSHLTKKGHPTSSCPSLGQTGPRAGAKAKKRKLTRIRISLELGQSILRMTSQKSKKKTMATHKSTKSNRVIVDASKSSSHDQVPPQMKKRTNKSMTRTSIPVSDQTRASDQKGQTT
ncbi:hypothetical protein IGI04_002340 [Brassica rapa subsp. trilocularis]|uniref:Uncharacterized protein n=1 Tax=Brassica rapa subsp. trilocularis TaxID=1813537 RepID=A0ABQ7NV88_BRACM|nr:hypothetical protein IGI04_002340 [Brassica rapa subsp. trilocularis]